MPYIPRQDARPPATGLLGGAEPHIEEMEKRQGWLLPGVYETDTGEHGPPSSTGPHHLCLLLEVPGTELLFVVHIRTQCKGPHWGDTPLPRGSWDLVLRMPEAIRDGMVREPDILRWTTKGITGHLDGPSISTPVGPGAEECLCYHQESGARSFTKIFQRRCWPAPDAVWRVGGDVSPTTITYRPDASGGRRLRRCFIGRQPDAVVPTSRHPRCCTTGGIRHGDRYAGCWLPRRYDATYDTSESAFTTPGGRPPGCLYTTACDVATGGAWPVHRKHKSTITDRPITDGPAVATYRRRCLLMAGVRSPPYSGCRQQRHPSRAT